MTSFKSRQAKLLLVAIAIAVGAGSLLFAGSALAETALFRVERAFHNFPNPAVTSPGGAGHYTAYIQPYATPSAMGGYVYSAATAIVEPGNPVGGAFTLPQSFFGWSGDNTITPKTGWPGYTTITHSNYFNGPGHFAPNNGAADPSRVVFPTTMGNSVPNYGTGNPVTATTTWAGQYDFDRAGSIQVTSGPNRFGGTMRVFYHPDSFWYQYVYFYTPAIYKGYADFVCIKNGVVCTPGTFVSSAGDVTVGYSLTRFLLNVTGTGTGAGTAPSGMANTARATTSTTPNGNVPTPSGNKSFITGRQQYMNVIHPFTTGFAVVSNPVGSPNIITPQYQGYDTLLAGEDISITRTDWNQVFNKTLSTLTTTTDMYTQHLRGVGRVVSMVRPKLIHTYSVPLDINVDPIVNSWNVARMQTIRVFFVPEPTGMLMLGAGIAGMLGLSRIRRR